MRITQKAWNKYITKMSAISGTAAEKMQEYVSAHGFDDMKAVVEYAKALSDHYGEAIGALACQMYDATAAAQGASVPDAEIAELPEYGDVAKAVYGAKKTSEKEVSKAVGRLVKQVGADTTLKNAERDGAQFAWVPSGDTCAFCITLASRGWQYMSKKALKNGHAEHIHANCDCQYAIRFDGKSEVEGYDSDKYLEMYENAEGTTSQEKINSMRRAMRAEQAYRKDYGTSKGYTLVKGGKDFSFSARKVESYESTVLVSDKAGIKPKALHEICKNTDDAMKEYGISKDRKPTTVILSDDEMPNSYGSFDACTNTIYYNQSIAKKAVQDSAGGTGAIERHETWHLKQAENFRNNGVEITKANYGDYLKDASVKAKKNLDRLGVTFDNVGEISVYAEKQYIRGRFDEAEAEYMAIRGARK